MGVHSAKRLPEFSYRGPLEYSITVCTFRRARWFVSATHVALARAQLLRISHEELFDVSAYCFMPDHVHVLLSGTADSSSLRRFVGRWKQHSAYAHKQRTRGILWQGGFYDHVLRQEED